MFQGWNALLASVWGCCLIGFTWGQLSDSPDVLRNWCLDSDYHKPQPGPEPQLFSECSPWKERSCCNATVSKLIHHNVKVWHGFQFRHCPPQVSSECLRFFRRDFCFYECSPNLGPWVEFEYARKSRQQRFRNVPLCASECEAWFHACKDDLTCVRNWGSEFDWIEGTNRCPENAKCQLIRDTYADAKDFCETVWDNDFKYTPDNEPCMVLSFDPSSGNPNDNVTEAAISRHMNSINSMLNRQRIMERSFSCRISPSIAVSRGIPKLVCDFSFREFDKMRQLKGKPKETPRQKKERKQDFSPENQHKALRVALPIFVGFWVLIGIFIYLNTRPKH
ncbi:unnamed protein product [Notodromas monacha]|uniref:Folate receptor-like domain-containing protein n=1 Tax=Notodromas monacha TaxID=399045 RepID=A0A7R9GAY7_9CRUS|nr:unnamed protein product [Notodromas monacha]CAG0914526.1 unnamed protein product [Notodromas monacha]